MGRDQTAGKISPKTKKSPRLKAVFFDAGNTLLRPYPSVGHIYAKVARRHGVFAPPLWVEERFQAAWAARHGVEQLAKDNTERRWWREMVKKVWAGHSFPRGFSLYFDDLYGQFAHPRHWRLFPDTLPALKDLRDSGLALGIISNWDSRLVTLSERIGLTRRVDFVLVSAVEGVVKPQKEIFKRALAKAGVRAAEALHVGDSLNEDYRGAKEAGLKAFLLERRGHAVAHNVEVISSLAEIPKYARIHL